MLLQLVLLNFCYILFIFMTFYLVISVHIAGQSRILKSPHGVRHEDILSNRHIELISPVWQGDLSQHKQGVVGLLTALGMDTSGLVW